MIVAGGIYVEQCIEPHSIVLLGSGGRAALALAGLNSDVTLHTFYPAGMADDAYASFEPFGVKLRLYPSTAAVHFTYLHSLAKPRVAPVPLPQASVADVSGDVVLRFGCLEGSFRVDAKKAVFDPQSVARPEPFQLNGSKAEQLALILNVEELKSLAGASDIHSAVASLFSSQAPSIVVVKAGADGAFVFRTADQFTRIPAFQASSIYKIGSGDIFSAAFAHYWGLIGMPAVDAAERASLLTAEYVESRILPFVSPPTPRAPITTDAAAPRHARLLGKVETAAQRWLLHEARESLQSLGLIVEAANNTVAERSVTFVAASGLDQSDVDRVSEAAKSGDKIVVYGEGAASDTLERLARSGCKIELEFVTALYRAAWEA